MYKSIIKYTTVYNNDRALMLVKEGSKRYDTDKKGDIGLIDAPEKARDIIEFLFNASKLPQEHFWVIALNGARHVCGAFDVTTGTLVSSLVHPRDVFARAMLVGAASIIIAHNHPSGSLNISEQDKEVTRRIRQSGELLGINLDDHIIISDGDFVSDL